MMPTRMFPLGLNPPYDAEVEYLESTGTQYVDTGINADQYLGFDLSIAVIDSSGGEKNVAGAILNSPLTRLHVDRNASNRLIICVGPGTVVAAQKVVSTDDSSFHQFVLNASEKTGRIDTETGTYSVSDFNVGLNFAIMARKTTRSFAGCECRLSSAKLYHLDTLVRDFTPVRVGTVGYLYDRVTRRLYGNSGTGSFVLGPDVT